MVTMTNFLSAAFDRERMQNQCLPQRKEEDLELPLFNLITINSATNYFSPQNKIGQGGFGYVYKVAASTLFFLPWNQINSYIICIYICTADEPDFLT